MSGILRKLNDLSIVVIKCSTGEKALKKNASACANLHQNATTGVFLV